MPKITALMPLFNGRRYIRESLESIQKQTFSDWEFIIVNDFGSDDGCADIVRRYAQKDPRIKLVQLEERFGLAASLNVGLEMAQGEYVARVDVDDPSEPTRFEKQVAYMDAHTEVSLCSVWQRSITPQASYVQKAAFEAEELKASMLFGCEISHCGVMLRKVDFDSHGWRYNPKYLGEDYELWCRMLRENAVIVNIPEVLVSHRWGFGNISIDKGERLREEVRSISAEMISFLGIRAERYNSFLFSGWRNRPENFAKENSELFLRQGYRLIQEIDEKNGVVEWCAPEALKKILFYRWNWIRESCGISFTEYPYGKFTNVAVTPVISVVLPTFCSVKEISRAIDCVQAQTFSDWELLVINDFGSDDGTAEIVRMYAWGDPRIRLIQAEERLGLAESLNVGMREARGRYIARLDADDTSMPERFEKQVAFMEAHPEVGICGTWQHHYGNGTDWVHEAVPDPEVQRCRLLFWCDLCHSTLMLRRDVFISNHLFYDSDAQAEDFELWTRAMEFMEIANIPEVLGEYNESSGITSGKIQLLAEESGQITARTLKRILNMDLPVYDCRLLNGWLNPLPRESDREEQLVRLKEILTQIWERNESVQFFDSKQLLRILAAKWQWVKNDADWKRNGYDGVRQLEDAFSDQYAPSLVERYRLFCRNNPRLSVRAEKIVKKLLLYPIANAVRNIVRLSFRYCLEEINRGVEGWTWDRFERTYEQQQNASNNLSIRIDKLQNEIYQIKHMDQQLLQRINLHMIRMEDEKIRIVFLFQVASFWPSWESFWESCSNDSQIEAKLVFLNQTATEKMQMVTARDFLKKKGLKYILYEDFNWNEFLPHVVVYQSPYDKYHRVYETWAESVLQKGVRIVYIPYGIEIADTENARSDHFRETVVQNSWRIYTFSETMLNEYRKYCANRDAVRAVGLPRFDTYFHKERYPLANGLIQRIQNRRVILWKVHFPKSITIAGKEVQVTPYLDTYFSFTRVIKAHKELFFIFVPHPKFLGDNGSKLNQSQANQIVESLREIENVYIEWADDYRNVLCNADAIIVDRSAVMVEAGACNVPVLYMYNHEYEEPLTKAIRPLIDSYYKGARVEDMNAFLEMVRAGKDPKREERNQAFRKCVPYFDGKCGERIKDEIIQSLKLEQKQSTEGYLNQKGLIRSTQLEERIVHLEQTLAQQINREHAEQNENAEAWVNQFGKQFDARIWKSDKRNMALSEEIHNHIDYTYRDIMIVLEKQLQFVGKHNLMLRTEFPCALESLDHKFPRGTAQDNTRYPRFIKKCETIFQKERGLSFLDLGCSGGGMVLDAVIRGHLGIGLEGSDWSLTRQRAEWRLLRENLFTCDITKPFLLENQEDNLPAQFDVITAWEVLEHIREEDLETLFSNIRRHLSERGIFVASIANWASLDKNTGINWHITMQEEGWWQEKFWQFGFEPVPGLIEKEAMARGALNSEVPYKPLKSEVDNPNNYFVVLRKQ